MDKDWRKSSYSTGQDINCLEARTMNGKVDVRDSQNRNHGHLTFDQKSWSDFISAIRQNKLS